MYSEPAAERGVAVEDGGRTRLQPSRASEAQVGREDPPEHNLGAQLRLSPRDRGGALRAPGGPGGRSGCSTGRAPGRGGRSGGRAETGRARGARGAQVIPKATAGELQVPPPDLVRRRAPKGPDGQDPEAGDRRAGGGEPRLIRDERGR